MTLPRIDHFVSRRTTIAGLTGVGLGLILGVPATAQDATPVATPDARANHTVVGAWQLAILEDQGHITTGIFNGDGTYLEYDADPRFGVGIGLWLATGEREVQLVTNYQVLAWTDETEPERKMFSVDYVPEPHAFLPGIVSIRLAYRVHPDEQTMMGTGTMEVRDGTNVIIAGPFGASPVDGIKLLPATS
jgi:hypothetical protein